MGGFREGRGVVDSVLRYWRRPSPRHLTDGERRGRGLRLRVGGDRRGVCRPRPVTYLVSEGGRRDVVGTSGHVGLRGVICVHLWFQVSVSSPEGGVIERCTTAETDLENEVHGRETEGVSTGSPGSRLQCEVSRVGTYG